MSIVYGRQLEHNAHCIVCGETLTQQMGESGEAWHERAGTWAKEHESHERGDPDEGINPQMQRDYMAARGLKCPYCQSRNIEQIWLGETDENEVTRTSKCHKCHRDHFAIFMLTKSEEMPYA